MVSLSRVLLWISAFTTSADFFILHKVLSLPSVIWQFGYSKNVMGKDNLLYKTCVHHLAWPLQQQQTITTLRVRYQLLWYAASLGLLKGRIFWERPTGKWQGFPRDPALLLGTRGCRVMLVPSFIAGGAEPPAWPASDVGAPGLGTVVEALMASEGSSRDLQWLCCKPLKGNVGCTTAVLEILWIGDK